MFIRIKIQHFRLKLKYIFTFFQSSIFLVVGSLLLIGAFVGVSCEEEDQLVEFVKRSADSDQLIQNEAENDEEEIEAVQDEDHVDRVNRIWMG